MEHNQNPPYIFYKLYPFIENLLKKLSETSSEFFIAGGCPRDIYLDRLFDDVDIYTTSNADIIEVINVLGEIPSVSGIKIQLGHHLPNHYKANHLLAVISFTARELSFQIIITNLHSRDKILDTFAVGLSQFYFEGRNIYFTDHAKKDMENNTLTVNPKFHVNSHYILKITKKFPYSEIVKNESPLTL